MSGIAASRAPGVVVATPARRFYARMAWVTLAVGVIGFAPTYWLPLARGALEASPLTHLHAVVFYGWLAFFVMQAELVAKGRTSRHREAGVLGVSLATAMCFVGLAMAVQSIRELDGTAAAEHARRFSIVSVSGIALFAALVAAAVVNVRKPEIHKRLMLVATAGILQAAVARWFVLALAPEGSAAAGVTRPPPPVAVSIPSAITVDLLIVAAMIHDRRTHGRVHPIYWIAGGLTLAVQLLRVPLSGTDAWVGMTDWLLAFVP